MDNNYMDNNYMDNNYKLKYLKYRSKYLSLKNKLLGDNRGTVETALASNSGANASSISKLLPLIAPVIMGYLGKQKQQSGVADEGGITDLIGKFTGGSGGLDIGNLIGMFTNSTQDNNTSNTNQTAQSGGGFLNIISNLFGKK